jgi:hypothetical protein
MVSAASEEEEEDEDDQSPKKQQRLLQRWRRWRQRLSIGACIGVGVSGVNFYFLGFIGSRSLHLLAPTLI